MFDRPITQEFLDFCGYVWNELQHADEKHGTWANERLVPCSWKVVDEASEVVSAAKEGDIASEHGIRRESVQVAVTAYKMFRRVANE